MKKIFLWAVTIFMLLMALPMTLDLTLVLLEYKLIPRSYPEYGMQWFDSPIFNYNVSRSANILMGAMAAAAWIGFGFYLWILRLHLAELRYRKWSDGIKKDRARRAWERIHKQPNEN